jgi:release factor glutamine methyltransferase
MARVLSSSRTDVIIKLRDPCSVQLEGSFCELVRRRIAGEPIAYIIGEREFWGLQFEVSEAVLVPRPESELLVEEALAWCCSRTNPRIVDLGTGSGCLAISLLTELIKKPGIVPKAVAVDISPDALLVAKRNAVRHGVQDYLTFIQGDWFTQKDAFTPPYDLVLANPPYLDPSDPVPVELSFEPANALFAEEGGLREIRRICNQTSSLITPGGMLLCEVGAGKRAALEAGVVTFQSRWQVSFLGDESARDSFTVLKIVFDDN